MLPAHTCQVPVHTCSRTSKFFHQEDTLPGVRRPDDVLDVTRALLKTEQREETFAALAWPAKPVGLPPWFDQLELRRACRETVVP